ncbi:MAG: hypothetical protein KKE76_13180 [Gammaproteobacteria bacterium]|nr:hypothetical protein [Gammaproteobacteria bacterium]
MSILSPVATQQLPLQRLNQRFLNKVALGGLLYYAAAWYLDQFLRPMMRNTQSHSH